MPGTITLHRVIKCSPEKLYRAFTTPEALARWIPPHGFTCKVHHMDVRVGGTHKVSFTNFTTGNTHSFGGTYLEVRPNELLRYNDQFDDPNLPGSMTVTVTLKAVSSGTDLHIVQDGVPDMIPLDMCYLGWQESLQYLANLVEPDIQE